MEWPKCEYKTQRARLRAEFATGQNSDYIFEPVRCIKGILTGEYSGDAYGCCPACGGTGERDLTADEAAEYLLEFYGEWESELCFYPGNEFPYELDIDCDICGIKGKTLTQALNAAARAVRDRRQGCEDTK